MARLSKTLGFGWGSIVVAGLFLAGCAAKMSVTENQCLAGDWETIGYGDGLSGYQSTRLLAHQEACGGFGVVPERASYLDGWNAGIAQFCTPDTGFSKGVSGASLIRACGSYADFAVAYEDGRSLYLARREVQRANKVIARKEARLDHLKSAMTDAATAQLEPTLTVKERLELVADLQELADERSRIKTELPDLYRDLESLELELDRLSDFLASAAPR